MRVTSFSVLDGNDAQVVFLRELEQLRQAHHRAVLVHDLDDHARGIEARETREIHRSFGLARANEHAPIARAQRKRMAGLEEVGRLGAGIEHRLNRGRPILGGDPRGGAMARFD
jgi:hypothetical protein